MSENNNIKLENVVTTLSLFVEMDACDMTATWRPSAAITAMQIATRYALEGLGISWSDLTARGVLWVVSRVNVKLYRIPRFGEQIMLRAIPQPPVKALYPWKFAFVDSEGRTLGEGKALWNLMDAATRHIVMIPEINARFPKHAEGMQGMELPLAASELEGKAKRQTITPIYTDLDINGHTSHLRYIDWCCNALGADVMRKYRIPEFRISYMQEVCQEQTVDTELRIEGSRFSFSGYHGEVPAFVIDGTLVHNEQAF